MGLLKNVALAFKPSNIARGLDAARNPPSQAEIEASLQHLSPEQRAAYDANMARVEQGREEAAGAMREALDREGQVRPLFGPAGRYVHGSSLRETVSSPEALEAQIAELGPLGAAKAMRGKRKGEFKDGLRQAFNRDLVEQVRDPAERDRIARAERAARDEARAPYRAADPAPVAISRLATRGETQLAEVLAWLGESALPPSEVFGVYRVPDRISGPLTPHSERGRVVEWDVVHTPGAGGFSGGVVATSFVAAEQWVARRFGEPSVFDEDLALTFCAEAGIGPERCFGLARISEFRAVRGEGSEDYNPIRTLVRGVVALHPPGGDAAYERLQASAPLPLADPAPGIHVEVLNWAAVARAVHPNIHEAPPVPSPFAYLPATPQELLRAYLEVVGLRPSDCYAAQATVDGPVELVQGGLLTKNWGAKQPCADGKERVRTTGCSQIVVVHRDAPEYAAGRERWTAYERDVLQARLNAGIALRTPLVDVDDVSWVPTKPLRALARVEQKIEWLETLWTEQIPPYRYCWPPVET